MSEIDDAIAAVRRKGVQVDCPVGTVRTTVRTTADDGWLLFGQTVTNAQTIYPALWAVVPAAWKSGSSIVLPAYTDAPTLGGAWVAWTPTVTASAGTLTAASGAGAISRSGRTISWWANLTITTNGTGSGAINFTLPADAPSSATPKVLGFGREVNVTGKGLSVTNGTTFGSVANYDNTYPAGSGYLLGVGGVYESSADATSAVSRQIRAF